MIDLNQLETIPSGRVLATPNLLPDTPGTYMLFFDSGECLLERSGYLEFDNAYPPSKDGYDLLYVGATLDNLRTRVMAHLAGDSRCSSLRMTVGALLAEDLDLEPVGDPSRSYFNFGCGEQRLTDWLSRHTKVAFHANKFPFAEEKELLRTLPIPLNISERKRHPYSKYLMTLRAYYAGRPSSLTKALTLPRTGAKKSGFGSWVTPH